LTRIAIASSAVIAVFMLIIHFITEQMRFGTLSVRTAGGVEESAACKDEVEKVLNGFPMKYNIKYESLGETSDVLYEIKHKGRQKKDIFKNICKELLSLEGVTSVKYIES
jgi:hypothetical protein